MTFSVLGRDASGRVGVVIASRVLAIGGRALRVHGRGLLVVQGGGWYEDLELGLRALERGEAVQEVVDGLAGLGREDAQYAGVLLGAGSPASWSGPAAAGWAGSAVGHDFCAQGNTLVGARVLEACRTSWLAAGDLRLEERLLHALAAGSAAGGDLRGEQSAAMLTLGAGGGERCDLRVDDDPVAVDRLGHLLTVERAHELLQRAWALVPADLVAADDLLRDALRLAPEDGLLLQTAALVLIHTGARDAAEQCWRQALPHLPDPAVRLGSWAALPWTDRVRLQHLERVRH